MFSKEYRPLKRPKLGVPDYYPQDSKQKEDELSYASLTNGFRSQSLLPPGEEFEGALKEFNQHFLNTKEYCLKVSQVEDERRRRRWVQDSEKKKLQVSKDNFFPVPLGRNRKEIATQWFQDLASNKPLSQLAKKVPVFTKKEEIFDNLCEKDVPISRAAWYIKMTSAYTGVMGDSKMAKKKHSTGPSFEWTLSLTRYMQDSVWRICNESQVIGRHDTHSSRTPSSSGRHSPSDETLMEITHWQYMLHLSSWLYEENLLDKHEFIHWLVERIEHVKSSDTKALQLHLPLVLRHLLDIADCVTLARPLVTYCCERLAALFEVEQRLHKLHPLVKSEPPLERVVETSEDDSVFNDTPSVKQEPGRTKEVRSKKVSTTDKKGDISCAPVISGANEDDLYFHWCSHHQAVMLELVCVIQTIAIHCPTAFIQVRMSGGRGILTRSEGDKVSSPLTLLPCSLTQLPMPTSLKPDLQKKLLAGLLAAEAELVQRNKAAETRWSSMTVADLQTTSEGSNVKQILRLLEVLDKTTFTSCRAHNPLTTLYCRIAEVQRSNKATLSDEMLTMLLCKWAVTPYRYGDHRPLVVAQILSRRQSEIIKGESWQESYDKDHLDECWEDNANGERLCEAPYPLQAILVKFLDTRAPVPDELSVPMLSTDPFFKLIVLFAELIRLDVFSYRLFLSTLIARGESRPPIIPCLPFARDGSDGDKSRKRQDSLNLSIPLPALKKLRYDQSEVSIASGPDSPVSSSSFGGIGLSTALDSLITSSPPSFQQDEPMEDGSASILEERAKKLQMLASEQGVSQMSQIMSPIDFNTLATDTDAPNSPIVASKSDLFNFSLSIFTEDEQFLDTPLNKQASRHLLFAAYFPIAESQLSQQSLNERSVVLCGVGKSRNKVESIVKKITDDVEHYYRLLSGIQTPVLPEEQRLQRLMVAFQSLPTFEQNVIATSCESRLRRSLSPSKPHPACAQLVFVCELLKVCGSISQILQLLVDVVAGNAALANEERGFEEGHRGMATPTLPKELRLPVIGLLQRYQSCLLLSQQDTTIVFEGLCRILDAPPTSPASLKSVFLFLHKLYTNCSFLQRTFRPTFGNYCVMLGEKYGVSVDWYAPTATDAEWQRTNIVQFLSKPSTCDVGQLCAVLKAPGAPPYLNANFIFVVDIFSAVCQKNVTSETLSQLAHICAEVCCERGVAMNTELLGAFRALCIPSQSNTKTGFRALTDKSNILMDTGIHSSLLIFVCLLISHNIFHLQDVIVYVLSAMIYVQMMNSAPGSTHQSNRSLEFATSLILHLLVPDYSEGHMTSEVSPPVRLPPFVQDSLHSKCRELNLGYVILLLKNLLKISHNNVSRERKTASLLVQSAGSGNEAALTKVRSTLEMVASLDWVRDKCSQQGSRLLDTDMLGDTSLTPAQARYLLHLLCPYSSSAQPHDAGRLAKKDPHPALEDILKSLDQWTLRNALLHIDVHVQQANDRKALQDHLASEVIHVFEDSCGDEWLGQTIDSSVESGDGSYSPRVWLVTPLVSKVTQSVLGRVLKSAGNVLGQGQWWNPEKNQEKRRSTRATSGVAPPKTGLQWQQPFLELVLACMHAQTNTHEELLGPLKSQLSTFLSAYDREGPPADEQSKTMLFAALKLRLSLVGSMLSSICATEQVTLEWIPLLMQLLCSGAVDRQTDTSELFTNCLDMLCTLLHSMPGEFQHCLATGGEEGKKAYNGCVKKLKSELNGAKSYCSGEIQQLFPLLPEAYSVTTVKQPDSVSLKSSFNAYTERIKGLRVQDSRDISPWDILEGVKSNGPLMLSWFGGVRVKRKPLRFEEQRWLLRFHTHQDQFRDMMYQPTFVKLPEAVPTEMPEPKQEDGQTPMVEGEKMLGADGTAKTADVRSAGQLPAGVPGQQLHPQMQSVSRPAMQMAGQGAFPRQGLPQRPMLSGAQMMPQAGMMRPGYPQIPGAAHSMNDPRKIILERIRANAIKMDSPCAMQRYPQPPMYRGPGAQGINTAAAQQQYLLMRRHHQRSLQMRQMQQMRNQQIAMQQGQYGGYHPGIQPMQANPPVPMHQVMRAGYRQQMMPQQGGMMGQPGGIQYPPQHPTGMNTMHRPGMF